MRQFCARGVVCLSPKRSRKTNAGGTHICMSDLPQKNPHPPAKKHLSSPPQRPSLKVLAEYLNLSPSTISFVLNNAPGRSIPPATRERVRAAARKFNYQPSLIARKLQGQRVKTVGITRRSSAARESFCSGRAIFISRCITATGRSCLRRTRRSWARVG